MSIKLLQQLVRRLAERDYLYEYSQKSSEFTPGRQVLGKNEYKILSSSITLSTVLKRDSYFLYEESIATAKSIQKLPNGNVVIIAAFVIEKKIFLLIHVNLVSLVFTILKKCLGIVGMLLCQLKL